MASSSAVNAAVSMGSRPARSQRTLRARRVSQTTAPRLAARTSIVRAAAAGAGADSDDASKDHLRHRRSQEDASNEKIPKNFLQFSKTPTPRTPGDLHRRAAAARARAALDATAADRNKNKDGGGDSSSSSSSSQGDHEFPYPYAPTGAAAAAAISPMGKGVCWSNLQDLDTVPDERSVYILVFGAGSGSEGLYSLQERTKEDVPVDIILAFPSQEDAARYGTLLEAEMGRSPVVEAARPEDLRFTCREGGYRRGSVCKVARQGVLLMPPEKTVEVTDWERTNALRRGQWSVQLDDSKASAAAHNLSEESRCQVMGLAGVDADGQGAGGVVGDEGVGWEEDEADDVGKLLEDYDEVSARRMLSRMFHSGDWRPTAEETE